MITFGIPKPMPKQNRYDCDQRSKISYKVRAEIPQGSRKVFASTQQLYGDNHMPTIMHIGMWNINDFADLYTYAILFQQYIIP